MRIEVDMLEKAKNKNKEVVRIVEKMKKIGVKVLRDVVATTRLVSNSSTSSKSHRRDI